MSDGQRAVELKALDTGLELWAGAFGDDYHRRNQVDWRMRIPYWQGMIEATGARSVFEMGCGPGWNLSAIKRSHPDVQVYGNDINPGACEQAVAAGLNVDNHLDFTSVYGRQDLTFTAGVLIHIEPGFLEEVMRALIAKSCRWVIAIEYEAPIETQVYYRGHKDKCWKRPYGSLYEDMGLTLRSRVPAGRGFDNCTSWLLERG